MPHVRFLRISTAGPNIRRFKPACPNLAKVQDHVRLGDIVIGTGGILEYDFVKETREGRKIRSAPQKPSARLLTIARDLQSEELLGSRPWDDFVTAATTKLGQSYSRPDNATDVLHNDATIVPHPVDASRLPGLPRIHSGAIGTADTLQKNPNERDGLRDVFGVRAIEMEASGIQSAAWAQGKDAFVVRGICDYCDDYKNDDWQNYAALIAAAYARALVERMPKAWF
jgi:nucleoside phosphorylase